MNASFGAKPVDLMSCHGNRFRYAHWLNVELNKSLITIRSHFYRKWSNFPHNPTFMEIVSKRNIFIEYLMICLAFSSIFFLWINIVCIPKALGSRMMKLPISSCKPFFATVVLPAYQFIRIISNRILIRKNLSIPNM